jgi:uncharacterized protein YndB with AHSA1/START domain
MATIPEHGYLLIADLTGYTAYLAGSELEHAPAIAGDLIETIIGRLEPPFRLAKLEGDAAFLSMEDGRADGPLVLDAMEAAYVAFRRRLRSIRAASACRCQACGLAPKLDLKIFLHHGPYVRRPIAGRDELAGPSVILVHRLLKGEVAAAAHDDAGTAPGFALITADAVAALGVSADQLGGLAVAETIEPFGAVHATRLDLEATWQVEQDRRRLELEPERVAIDLGVEIEAPPAAVWAYLTSPGLRSAWEGSIVVLDDPGEPRGVGTTARCVTGRLATLEEVVDWQPYDHVAYRLAVPGVGPAEATYDLAASPAGTSVRLRWAPASVAAPDPSVIGRVREERRAALERLTTVARARPGHHPAMEVPT